MGQSSFFLSSLDMEEAHQRGRNKRESRGVSDLAPAHILRITNDVVLGLQAINDNVSKSKSFSEKRTKDYYVLIHQNNISKPFVVVVWNVMERKFWRLVIVIKNCGTGNIRFSSNFVEQRTTNILIKNSN